MSRSAFCLVHVTEQRRKAIVRMEEIFLADENGIYTIPATAKTIESAKFGATRTLRIKRCPGADDEKQMEVTVLRLGGKISV